VFAVAWLKTKICFGKALSLAGRRVAGLVRATKRRILRKTQLEVIIEMREPVNSSSEMSMSFD
jgi:hypothetical protein